MVEKLEKCEYRVLLFYKYVEIANPETVVAEHLKACKEIGLKVEFSSELRDKRYLLGND